MSTHPKDRIQRTIVQNAIKFSCFTDAEKADRGFYANLTPEQRLEIFFALCAQAYPEENHANLPRMARVYRIVKLNT